MTSIVRTNASTLDLKEPISQSSAHPGVVLEPESLLDTHISLLPQPGKPQDHVLPEEQAIIDRFVNGDLSTSQMMELDISMGSPQQETSLFDVPSEDIFPDTAGSLEVIDAPTPYSEDREKRPALPKYHTSSINGSDMASTSSSKDLGKHDDIAATAGNAVDGKDKKDTKPAWSELKTKAGKERKRLPLACIACRRKKIRCSGEKPACKHCLRSRIPCVYKVTTRKAAPRTDYMTMLDKRLKRMEERVIKIIPSPDPAKMASIGRASVKPPAVQAPKAAGAKKRAVEEAFGDEVEHWSHPGGKAESQHTALQDRVGTSLQTDGAEFLPSKEIQEHLAEVFFDCCYGQAYHLLHKPSFQRRLRNGAVPPVLILSICAMSARFSTHPQINSEPAFLRGEQWAKPAREIALKHYDEPNITILITLMIMGLHEFGTCQGGRSWMLAGMAMRMAHSLQLHRELDGDPLGQKTDKAVPERSFTDREIRRRAMWGCFMMDRFISSGTERPMMLNERDIEIQLPVSEFMYYHETPGITETLDGKVAQAGATAAPLEDEETKPSARDNMGVAAYIVRVIALWGRVVRYINLGGKKTDRHQMWSEKSKFQELKRLAESFPDMLPERLRYTPENLRVHKTEKIANQFLMLHIAHQEILLFLHRFAIPTRPGSSPPSDMPQEFVKMAVRAAIDAANKVSQMLSDGPTNSLMAPFIGYCAFLSSTVHVWCIFSKNPALEGTSKKHLATNVRHLKHLKKYWGLMYHMSDNLRTIYRQFADAATRKSGGATDRKDVQSSEHDTVVLEYGSWLSAFPHGVSHADYQEPAPIDKKNTASDAALSQRSDLQTVEEFFDTLQPPALPQRRTKAKRTARQQQGPKKEQQPKQQQQQLPTSAIQPPQRRRTLDATPQARPLNTQIKPEQQPQTWSPPTQFSPQVHSPFSTTSPVFPISQQQHHQTQQQGFRRPSTHARQPAQQQQRHGAGSPAGQHRASFDAGFAQQARLHTSGLNAYAPNMNMYSPHEAFGAPVSTASSMGALQDFNFAAAGEVYGLGMGIGDIDRQRVFSAHATDPGVAMEMWDFSLDSQQGGQVSAVAAQQAAMRTADVSGRSDHGSAADGGSIAEDLVGMGGMAPDDGAGGLADAPGSAWFMPFNMHVDTFGAPEFGMGDGHTPSLHAEGSGDGEGSAGGS